MTGEPRVIPFGDAALLVEFDQRIDQQINAQVLALAAAIDGRPGWRTPVPAYASLLAPFDPTALDRLAAERELHSLLEQLPPAPPVEEDRPVLELPVRYGGADGPDLEAVAGDVGLSPADVIELHAGTTYRAYFLGFAPGFAYLGELPAQLEVARLPTPRQRVPAGSVAIAGRQTAVYPLATPGGWRLIGRTDVRMWDAARPAPALITAGRRVRFVPVA
ncbi:MAG TPA: 5-oxoprolinase subunit PxpB [Candidatus Limnocylindria bacterium]|nr:5-oxoprolinase subunit PxpB [Candidatus Limnocylindria bacterium]